MYYVGSFFFHFVQLTYSFSYEWRNRWTRAFISILHIYIYNLGDTHSKHGTSGWHKRSPGNSGEGDGDPHNPMPRLSVCADSHKVDRSKLAQTEVCSKFFLKK